MIITDGEIQYVRLVPSFLNLGMIQRPQTAQEWARTRQQNMKTRVKSELRKTLTDTLTMRRFFGVNPAGVRGVFRRISSVQAFHTLGYFRAARSKNTMIDGFPTGT